MEIILFETRPKPRPQAWRAGGGKGGGRVTKKKEAYIKESYPHFYYSLWVLAFLPADNDQSGCCAAPGVSVALHVAFHDGQRH
jgi:hypothetical protein